MTQERLFVHPESIPVKRKGIGGWEESESPSIQPKETAQINKSANQFYHELEVFL
jgi:hypothetical protein